ncbi:hypothetical protein PLICRDRAFT_51533 [Plicaturopsis crispa FD-325 SS-3]|nr:hypothetical protein PLICRDRAFT_51533 [Plicaturopsis crispa FD-325 SS-3]
MLQQSLNSQATSSYRRDSFEETKHLVESVFRAVWNEFYAWEDAYCRTAVAAHARKRGAARTSTACTPSFVHSDVGVLIEDATDIIDTRYYSEEGVLEGSARIPVHTLELDGFTPHAPYEFCTPSSRNILVGDDSDDMNFIPYADDPKFDIATLNSHYESFSWQKRHDSGPDLEAIVVETARRLNSVHGVRLAHIDETEVLPLELISRPGKAGLVYPPRQRETIKWPGQSTFPLNTSTVPEACDLKARLVSCAQLFCPNLNCVQPCCPVHVETLPTKDLTPSMTSSELVSEIQTACSAECALLSEPNVMEDVAWDNIATDTLRTILGVSPDLSPCALAALCQKSCREVLAMRKRIFPDKVVHSLQTMKRPLSRKGSSRIPEFEDAKADTYTPNEPCFHDGPCDKRSQCACYLNKAHCGRNCGCGLSCKRRHRGCRCVKAIEGDVRVCGTQRCSCFREFRECDPELCHNCDAKNAHEGSCGNCDIQLGRKKGLEIKSSHWGLGAFLTESAHQHDLIAEYIGELIFEPTCDSRDVLVKHRKRNYIFGLNETLVLDASKVGNETRFLNHVRADMANARACVRLVNGEHRIGIFATKSIKAGEEVLFDYGAAFFAE